MNATLEAGERLLQNSTRKAKRSSKPAQALVFDEQSGEFVNPGRKRRASDRAALQFEPVGAGAGTGGGQENNGWIVEV